MKKSVALALSLLFLTACGQGPPTPADDPVSTIVSTTAPEDEASPANASVVAAVSTAVPENEATPFDKFEAGLDDVGYSYETTMMAAELVGAHIGVKYKFDFGTVELYQFEHGSDTLAKAVEDGGLTLEGFGVVRCEFNGNLATVVDVAENEDTLLSLFNSL